MTKKKAPSPIAINPNGCIDHCYGCGNNCSVGAIAYVGDDTGWLAAAAHNNGNKSDVLSDCCCGCYCKE